METLAALLDIKYKKEADGVYSHENLISLVDDKGMILKQLHQEEQTDMKFLSSLKLN